MSAQSVTAMLAEWDRLVGMPDRDPAGDCLRVDLHAEETRELLEAIASGDRVRIAHELADVVYVAYGSAAYFGIDLDAVIAEVHAANLSKMGDDGLPIFRADGKVLKGPNYRYPDVAGLVG